METETSRTLRAMVDAVVCVLVDDWRSLEIAHDMGRGATFCVTIVGPGQVTRRLIGKSGVTVGAIRTILHAGTARLGLKSQIRIADQVTSSTSG